MKLYNYTAVTAEGKTIDGTMEAEDEAAAQQMLAQGGLYPVSIKQGSSLFAGMQKITTGRKVKLVEIVELAQNLSIMLRAGVAIIPALVDFIETTENRAFVDILTDIKHNVERGERFTDALERHASVFPDIFIKVVRVGEETGRFESSLADVADHLKNVSEVTTAVKQALIYPIFAITTTLGALIFWMIYVLPKMITTMKEMSIKLPLMTRALIAASTLTQKYWYVMIVIPVALTLVFRYLNRQSSTRYYLDKAKLNLPIVKLFEYDRIISLFSEQMHILISSGLTIDKCFDMAADVIGNEIYRRSLMRVKETVTLGNLISSSLKSEMLYPSLVVRMVSIGESSGTLDTQFAFLSEHYRAKLNNFSKNLGKVMEPLVIMVVGGLFVVIIMALLLPFYDVISIMGTKA
jgi:type II secretory pathway component PulF